MRSDSDTARAFTLFYPLRAVGIIDRRRTPVSASASTSDGIASIDAREQQRQRARARACNSKMSHRPMAPFPSRRCAARLPNR